MALEFNEQLSRLQKPDRAEMTDEEYAVFAKNVEVMEKNWGFINNLFKVLPLNAKQYIGFLNFKGSLFNDSCWLTDAQKEMIGVVVSSYNCCSYCLTTHGDNLRGMWKNAELVDKLSYNFRSCKVCSPMLIMHCASTHGLLLPTPVRLMPYRLRSCVKLV